MVDSTERVSAFLRHRDCNYVDALDQKRMEPDSLRLALLGAIRYSGDHTSSSNKKQCVAEFFDETGTPSEDHALERNGLST